MTGAPLLLGIDLGTSAVKALLVDAQGTTGAVASAEYPILHPRPGCAEQDPEAWWRATAEAVHAVVAGNPDEIVGRIAAIGLSGQMHGTVLLDGRGNLLAPAVIWPDQRSAAQVAEITALVGAARLYEIAGSPVATGFQAATVRWFQQDVPELWRQVRMILAPKDYLRWRLTGTFATDPSDGAGTLLLDEARRDWSDVLLDLLAVRRDQLPPVQPSAQVAGGLSAAAAADLGLTSGIPVVTGAADTACSALGAGMVDEGRLLLTLSTGGQLLQPVASVRWISRAASTRSAAGWSRRRVRRAGTRWGQCWRRGWRCAGCATRCLAGGMQRPMRG